MTREGEDFGLSRNNRDRPQRTLGSDGCLKEPKKRRSLLREIVSADRYDAPCSRTRSSQLYKSELK
jgi:hypothetical protein